MTQHTPIVMRRLPATLSILLLALLTCVGSKAAAQCTTWLPYTNSSGLDTPSAYDHSAVISSSGTPYFAYYGPTGIICKRYTGSTWVSVDAAGTSESGAEFPHLAIDGSDNVYIVYYYNDGSGNKIAVKKLVGTTWVLVGSTIDDAGAYWDFSIAASPAGQIHLCYTKTDGHIAVRKYNGSAWEDVGTPALTGYEAILNFSPGGTPFVAVKSFTNSVSVIKYNGVSWTAVGGTVAASVGSVSLAIDASETPFLAIAPDFSSKVMTFNGTSWVTVGDIYPAYGRFHTICFDSGGTLYASGSDGEYSDRLVTRKYEGGSWHIVGQAGVSSTFVIHPIVISSGSGMYVAYGDPIVDNFLPTVIKLYSTTAGITGTSALCPGATTTLSFPITGGIWSMPTACGTATVGASTGVVTAIASGNPTVYYSVASCHLSTVVTINPFAGVISGEKTLNAGTAMTMTSTGFGGGAWSSSNSSIATISSSGVVTGVSAGTAVISYTISGSCGSATATKTITVNPSASCLAWNALGALPSLTELNSYVPTVRLDGTGTPYVVAIDADNGDKLTVRKYVGGTWTVVGTPDFSPAGAGYPSLAVQPDGTVYVVFADAGYDSKATVMKYNGISWTTVGTRGCSFETAFYPQIEVTSCGDAYISYYGALYNQTIMKYDGSSWVELGHDFNAFSYTQSMAIDKSGAPYVVYLGDDGPRVSKYSNGEWVNLGDGPIVVGLGSLSTFDMTLAPNGTPYMAYTDYYNDGRATVYKYNGSDWVLVGAAPMSNMSDPVIRVDAANNVYVMGHDLASTPAIGYVFKYDGTSWAQVGSGAFAHNNVPYFDLSADGVPYIVYDEPYTGQMVATLGAFDATISGPSVVAPGSVTYLGSTSKGGTWSSSDLSVVSFDPVNAMYGESAGTATVSYTLGACVATKAVTVSSPCATAAITGTASLCAGAATTLSDATSGGTWSSSNTTVAAVGSATGVVTGVAGGTSMITYHTSGCDVTKAVTVTATPDAGTISGASSVCAGNTTTLSNATTGGAWSSSNTAIATVGSSSGIVSGITSGNATITYSVSGSCGTATTTAVVTVNTTPSAGAITGTATVCTGNTTTLSNATAGGTWSSSNGSIATVGSSSGIVSGVTAGNATITYTLTNSCGTATATEAVTVNTTPSTSTITGTATVCTGNTTTLSNATTGGAWSSSNTAIATVGAANGVVSGVAAGNAAITYTVTNGCGSATATRVVTVNAGTSAGTITGPASICTGATTTLSDAVTGGAWSSSNPSVASVGATTGIVTGVSSGNATITYTVSGSCGSATATAVVTVGTSASITGSLALCAGMTSTLSGGASGGTWTSGNTAVATIGATSGVLTAVSTGTANITYDLGSGCTAMAVATVSMPAIIGGTSNACVGQTATLTDATTGGTWSSTNTSLASVDATTGVVTGVAAGTVTISYNVSTGCYRTITFTVKALPPAIAGPVTVCAGATAYVPPPSSNGLSWSSSNTSVATIGSSSGMLTGVAAGTTTLTYTTNTGCYVTTEATVNAAPASITGTTALCAGGTSSLGSATAGGTWSSSNTSVATVGSATGVLTAVNAGNATISYTVAGCRTTTVVTVSAMAAITGTPSMCVGSSVTLSDATAGGTWSSSNAGIATVGTSGIVTGTATGNAIITYTIASGCTRTVTATVIATPGPITGSLSACPASTAALSGAAGGGTWSGGNPSIATINSSTGVVNAVGAGTINVSYTLTGCRATAIFTVNPQPAAITGTANACVAQTSALSDVTTGGTWSSNNVAIATIDPSTGLVTAVTAATTTMTYTLGTGCYRTIPFTVKALPPAITASVAACVGTTTYIAPPSTNGKSWSSSTTSVATIGSSTGIMTGVSTGTTTLTYTTTTGCFVTTEATVYALPSAGTITGPTTVIISNTITLNDAVTGGVWSSSSTAKATIGAATGIVTGVAAGSTTISYSVSNPGCTVRATQVISVTTSRPGGNGITGTNFRLYPNPTTGAFTVEADEAGTFSIFSLDGREVSRDDIVTGINQLSLAKELASGIYMCRFTGETGNTTMVRLVYER